MKWNKKEEIKEQEIQTENVEEIEIQNEFNDDETISENAENVEETKEVEENETEGIKTL